MSEQNFLNPRDNRTDRILVSGNYKKARIAVVLGPKMGSTFAGQVMAITASNLLARAFNNLTLVGFQHPLIKDAIPSERSSLSDEIGACVKDINSAIAFHTEQSCGLPDFILGIGADSIDIIDGATPSVIIDADGWISVVNPTSKEPLLHESTNVIGPVFAACLGVSELLKLSENLTDRLFANNRVFSLFSYKLTDDVAEVIDDNKQYPSQIQFGKILMIGAGSVASGVAYLLRLINGLLEIDIVDSDVVTIGNLSKSPAFFLPDVGFNKAQVLSKFLERGNIIARAWPFKYSDYSAQHLAARQPNQFDVVLPLADMVVDEHGNVIENARTLVQSDFHPLLIHGTTTKYWGINIHRHIPFTDDCLSCRFPPEFYNIKFPCGEATCSAPQQQNIDHIALPFQPLMAAVGVVAELIKLQLPEYPFNENMIFIDVSGFEGLITRINRRPSSNCACNNMHLAPIFQKWHGLSRYSHLVKPSLP